MLEQRTAELAGSMANTLQKATYGAATGTSLLGLTIEQWTSICGLIGVLVGIAATIIVASATIYFRRKEFKLKEARSKHEWKDYDEDE